MKENQIVNGVDISTLSIKELENLKELASAQVEIKSLQEYKRNLKKTADIIAQESISILDLIRVLKETNALHFSHDKNVVGRKAYYNPAFPLDIYLGWGRKPKWIELMEKDGVDIEQYTFTI